MLINWCQRKRRTWTRPDGSKSQREVHYKEDGWLRSSPLFFTLENFPVHPPFALTDLPFVSRVNYAFNSVPRRSPLFAVFPRSSDHGLSLINRSTDAVDEDASDGNRESCIEAYCGVWLQWRS